MAKNRKISSSKKKKKAFIRFRFGMLLVIFSLSFLSCFALYMITANLDENFFDFTVSNIEEEGTTTPIENSSSDGDNSEIPIETEPVKTNVINPVPKSERADDSYFDDAWFICDSSLLEIKHNTSISNIIGNDSLNAINVNTNKVESNYGMITSIETLRLIKPKVVYIMLGSELGTVELQDMINSYSSFVASIMSSMPDTKIYLLQLPPIYVDNETVSNEKIDEYNAQLFKLAENKLVHCVDTNTDWKNNVGSLKEEYYSVEQNTLTSEFYTSIYEYILTHIAQ